MKQVVVSPPTSLGSVKADRDEQRARQRYLRMSKEALGERLLAEERAFAEQRERWLVQQDEVLTWRLRAEAAESQIQALKEKTTQPRKQMGNFHLSR
jgi:hypothetical protein